MYQIKIVPGGIRAISSFLPLPGHLRFFDKILIIQWNQINKLKKLLIFPYNMTPSVASGLYKIKGFVEIVLQI